MSKPRFINAKKIKITAASLVDKNGDALVLLSDVQKSIAQTPTEDVKEVVHGRWEKWEEVPTIWGKDTLYVCSECSAKYLNESSYCPYCGAVMDGDKKGVELIYVPPTDEKNVVHCQECKNYKPVNKKCGNCHCTTYVMHPDDFCSRGVRKDGEE